MQSKIKWRLAQSLEIRWWKRYLRKQSVQEYLEKKKAYWHRVLEQCSIQPSAISGKILDAGCGPAGIFTILNTQEVTAIDPLLQQYEANLSHFDPQWYPNVTFQAQKIETLSQANHYDWIFCLNAINHVEDIELAMDRLVNVRRNEGVKESELTEPTGIRKLSKPRAKILLSIDVHKYTFLKWLFRLIPGDALHPHQYDLKEYRTMLEKRGCVIEREVILKKGTIFDYVALIATRIDR